MRRALIFAMVFLLPLNGVGGESIVNSAHNLSVSGPGPVQAVSEERVCVFCHTPHGARTEAPLWNRRDSAASYIPYDSPTISANPGQPTGSSKLCLSCHDGTIALGDLVSESGSIAMAGGMTMPPGGSRIGTDLRDDHPISFSYSAALAGSEGELTAPHAWHPEVKLDGVGMMQCTTCHDPHDPQWGKFLVMDNTGAALCRECHTIAGFEDTPHAMATNTWNGSGQNPWPHTEFTDVASNSCLNCHSSHHAPGREGLLTSARDEQVCLDCHDGSVADSRIADSFRKPYRHPVAETTGHEMGELLHGRSDHVTCVDCHNPHRARSTQSEAPFVQGVMEGVSGVTESGTFIAEAVYEYEVCFKCHAEERSGSLNSITRQIEAGTLRESFSAASPSFHPVTTRGNNSDVPSLISTLTEDSMIYCSDCHGDDTPAAMGLRESGAPHGSRHRFMLTKEYQTGDNITESPAAYSLCYSCHDRSSILSNESFPGHRRHIVDERTPCSVCHDAHGIDALRGNSTNNAFLMNFDIGVVQPSANGELEYTSLGGNTGTCSLNCHGNDHDRRAY